jgi:hypothetical protein
MIPFMQISQVSLSGSIELGSLLNVGGSGNNDCEECAAAATGLWNDLDGDVLGAPGQVESLIIRIIIRIIMMIIMI